MLKTVLVAAVVLVGCGDDGVSGSAPADGAYSLVWECQGECPSLSVHARAMILTVNDDHVNVLTGDIEASAWWCRSDAGGDARRRETVESPGPYTLTALVNEIDPATLMGTGEDVTIHYVIAADGEGVAVDVELVREDGTTSVWTATGTRAGDIGFMSCGEVTAPTP